MRGVNDAKMKKAPANFDDEDDDVGDVEENAQVRGRPGPAMNQGADNKGMAIDQRGA